MIDLVNGSSNRFFLDEPTIALIDTLGQDLKNRTLKGYQAKTTEEIQQLPPDEVDVAHGLLLEQFPGEPQRIASYERALDLMALQVRATLHEDATPEEIAKAINNFVFYDMGFRFPPTSLYAAEIDRFTFLSSVIEERRGVCLGVSILYLSLAQRLGVNLEAVTPPGHIYVRLNDTFNIETTMRGVHIPSDHYLSINTRALQTRTLKEVIGLAFVNQASVFWKEEKYEATLESYKKARPYLPSDVLLKELTAYIEIILGHEELGKEKLRMLQTPPWAVSKHSLIQDVLEKRTDRQGLIAVFNHVDQTEASILGKIRALEEVLERFPNFATGLFHLGMCHLQLGRPKQALACFETYHTLHPDVLSTYYLAILSAMRLQPAKSWEHYHALTKTLGSVNHAPHGLKDLKHQLFMNWPFGVKN